LNSTIKPSDTPIEWKSDALFLKAERYIQRMSQHTSDEWEYALWSSLSLELLARAALANVSPALLADNTGDWSHLYYSLGFAPNKEKFAPRSIPVNDVFARLSSIMPEFTTELENFCKRRIGMRNAELHSGLLAFDNVKSSMWQPEYYRVCTVLLASMGKTLEDFLGAEEAAIAEKIIEAAADKNAKAVQGDIKAHKAVWFAKQEEERSTLSKQAKIWATRYAGHRVDCPACGSRALVHGEPVSAPSKKLENDEITETQEHLPSQFECVACGLKISGLSQLTVAGLGDRYKKTQVYDAAEYYAPSDEHEGYEEDNNEW